MRIVNVGLRGFTGLSLLAAVVFCSILFLTPSASAQSQPLAFENNYFVTGDYTVGGVGLRGQGRGGLATGTISIPDTTYGANSASATPIPAGADIVAAFLYWETVESSSTSFQGQNGFFQNYAITGTVLGNPNAPVSWSSGGCSGSANGTKTLRTYRADVRPFLPVGADGSVQANSRYTVSLPDSGSNGSTTPLTLGATLVLVWRVLDKSNPPTVPLNAIMFFDGSYAPTNGSTTMTLPMWGFYQPTQSPTVKLTHIVGSGQTNKFQQVFFGNSPLTPPNQAAFPGIYSGSWDNPTYVSSNPTYPFTLNPTDSTATTQVVPSSSNSGCVTWGAVVMSTTVQDTDNDGLLDSWEAASGYCDAVSGSTSCGSSSPYWVSLPNADPLHKDVFIQLDYMYGCSAYNADGTCSSVGHSHLPPPDATNQIQQLLGKVGHDITVHYDFKNGIQEQNCVDQPGANPPVYCAFPSTKATNTCNPANGDVCQPGIVGWKSGYEAIKSQPLNYPDNVTCLQNPDTCVRRFQHGRKDSYHYALFGHALAASTFNFRSGSLVSVSISGTTVTITTASPHHLVVSATAPNGRVSFSDAITSPGLNGLYFVKSVSPAGDPNATTFTVQLSNVPSGTKVPSPTPITDPAFSVTPGKIGSGSGYSDIGGADSLITLGMWGPDGQTVNAQAGTFLHEFGHSISLTHGGYYFDNALKPFLPTFEANCKANYLSVMNYLFQVDLLGPNGVLDYSTQQLTSLDENNLSNLSLTDGTDPETATTKWYTTVAPFGIGTPATHYCNGVPLPVSNPPQMFRVEGSTKDIVWDNNKLDINFDSKFTGLRGYDDWSNIDLRQVGATGSDVAGGIQSFGGGIQSFGGGIQSFGGGIQSFGGGIQSFGGGIQSFGGGQGAGELDFTEATSVTRPPRNLVATPSDTRASHSVALGWDPPTFGQVDKYKIYRGDNPAGWPQVQATIGLTDGPTGIVDCTTYTYLVSDTSATTGNESTATGPATYNVPCPAAGLALAQTVTNNVNGVTLTWSAAPTTSGAVYGYNIYRDNGSTAGTTGSPIATVVGGTSTTYTDTNVTTNSTYTYSVTAVLVDATGCAPNTNCRESTQISKTITVSFKQQQTITFTPNPLPDKTWGDADFSVTATASSSLAVSFAAAPATNCTVDSTTGTAMVHIIHAGACTITASQAGDATYYPAPNVDRPFTINKANPSVSVTGYNLVYDGNPHTATGTAKGAGKYSGDTITTLDLSGTTHTNAATYNDTWNFNDTSGNYNNTSGSVTDVIQKANPTIAVAPYSVNYDGAAHSATGTATGVKGENLIAMLNLSGTIHTSPGTYTDTWAFVDTTGNYNNATAQITDVIIPAVATVNMTVTPSPSTLGQSLQVNFSTSNSSGGGTPTGTIGLSDVSGASCSATLAGGAGTCTLTLPVIQNGKAVVGNRVLTASYSGDANFASKTVTKTTGVYYNFVGYLSPLSLGAYSGSFNLGKSIPIKWQLLTSNGTSISMDQLDLTKLTLIAVFNGKPINGGCPVNSVGATKLILFSAISGAPGNSSFKYGSNQYAFNWDTTVSDGAGCYTITLQLDDGSNVKTTSLQLK